MCLWRFSVVPGSYSGSEVRAGIAGFLRLVALMLLLCASCSTVRATVPEVSYWYFESMSSMQRYHTQEGACKAGMAELTSSPTWSGTGAVFTRYDGWCYMDYVNNMGTPQTNFAFGRVFPAGTGCPANSTSAGASCTCDAGYKESGGQCVYESTGNSCAGLSDFCSGLKGEKINLEGKGTAAPPGCSADSQRPNCPMGCAGEAVGMGVSYKTADGSWMTGQEYRVTGGTCTLPQPSDIPQKKESDCAGSVGEVNGIRTCVPNQAATGDTSSKETKNPDGTSSNTESKTTCEKGVCTTTSTTTTKDASGNTTSTSTSSSSSSQREYCAANKASTVCAATNGDKNPDGKDGSGKDGEECKGDDCKETPSKFTGSCEAGFSCDGDALQCAIAQDQHRRTCQLFDTQSAESRLYDSEKGKTGSQTKDLPGNETIDFGSNRIDTSSALGGGTCLTDLQISVMGHSETLPLSQYCKWLDYAGNILVAVALLGALRIITRS